MLSSVWVCSIFVFFVGLYDTALNIQHFCAFAYFGKQLFLGFLTVYSSIKNILDEYKYFWFSLEKIHILWELFSRSS